MYDITCPHCQTTYLVGPGAIDSFHNTSEGPIAYVRCPKGHHLIRAFRARATEAAPALAERQVDEPGHQAPAGHAAELEVLGS